MRVQRPAQGIPFHLVKTVQRGSCLNGDRITSQSKICQYQPDKAVATKACYTFLETKVNSSSLFKT